MVCYFFSPVLRVLSVYRNYVESILSQTNPSSLPSSCLNCYGTNSKKSLVWLNFLPTTMKEYPLIISPYQRTYLTNFFVLITTWYSGICGWAIREKLHLWTREIVRGLRRMHVTDPGSILALLALLSISAQVRQWEMTVKQSQEQPPSIVRHELPQKE